MTEALFGALILAILGWIKVDTRSLTKQQNELRENVQEVRRNLTTHVKEYHSNGVSHDRTFRY